MPCYRPLTAYQRPDGTITFNEGGDSGPPLELPCGRCIGCRIRRVQDWTNRCMHEAAMHDCNSFVTLTYRETDNDQVSLDYKHFQSFIRELRRTRPVRFFAAGEYGEQTFRPHWHALLFGVRFQQLYPVGANLYASPELDSLWKWGYASIGEVTQQSAAYVASYCIKKATGPLAEKKYTRYNTETGEIFKVTPEMARMSLKPGIGATWYAKYQQEIHFARDAIIQHGGKQQPIPRYYDKLLTQQTNKTQQHISREIEIETNRQLNAIARQTDNTTQRLQAKEIVAIARQSQKQRKLK